MARALNAGCVDILWRHLLRISSSLTLVRSGRSLGTLSVSYFAIPCCIYLCIFIVRVLLALIACSSYLVIIYRSSVTDRVLCIVRVFVLLPL